MSGPSRRRPVAGLGAEALEQPLEALAGDRRVELGAEVPRQAHPLDLDVGGPPARGAADRAARPAPQPTDSIFGGDLVSERSLDEVILSYLAEDLEDEDR